MGSNMQRQAVPMKESELSFIEIGKENQIPKASQLTKVALESGKIEYASYKKIIQKTLIKKSLPANNKSITLKLKEKVEKGTKHSQANQKLKIYKLESPRKSNQNTLIRQNPCVKYQEWIKKGQTVTNGPAIKNGKLCLGKNILAGYMTWEGYNFEDAIVINQRLVDEDIFTSIHIKRHKVFLMISEKEEVRISN